MPPHFDEIRPVVDRASALHDILRARPLSLSRCSLKLYRMSSRYFTYYTVFFHSSLATMMTDFTQTPEKPAKSAKSAQTMPAEFGLATATFVVVAGMVGAGVLTTSGYTVALVGSNQWMLLLWVLGGVTAVCGALDARRTVGGPAPDGRRLRLSLRSLWSVARVSCRAGFRF